MFDKGTFNYPEASCVYCLLLLTKLCKTMEASLVFYLKFAFYKET